MTANQLLSGYVTLQEFVAVDEPGAEPLACSSDGGTAIPAGGLVVAYGNGGAGKTTLFADAAFHFAAGVEWLRIKPARPLCVVWIENEGPRPEFRKKLAAKLEAWTGPSIGNRFHVHEDPWGRFSFRDEEQRRTLIQRLNDVEADLLIAGPVKALGMHGGGTDDDIGDFLTYVEAVQRETGVTVCLIHHENRQGQISGAWESRPDTLLHVQAQGHGRTRLFWQKARWSSALHGTSSSLLWTETGFGFQVEEREDVTDATIADRLLAAALEHGGGSWNTLDDATPGKAADKRRVREQLLKDGLLVNVGAGNRMVLWHRDDPARPTASQGGTHLGTHRVSPASDGGAVEVRPASPVIGGRGRDALDEPHFAGVDSVGDGLFVWGES